MEDKEAKEILGRYNRLRYNNTKWIESFVRRGSKDGRENEMIEKIEKRLQQKREAGLLVQAVTAQIQNKTEKQILELRFLSGFSIAAIARELYGDRRDYEEHIEAYRVRARHWLGYALTEAAKVMRKLGLDEDPGDCEDPED